MEVNDTYQFTAIKFIIAILFISYVQSKWLDFPPFYNSDVFDKWQIHGAMMGMIPPTPSQCLPPENCLIVVSQNVYFGGVSGPFEYMLLHCNTSRYRLPLPSLTFQTDCGLIKGAGVPAKEDGRSISQQHRPA